MLRFVLTAIVCVAALALVAVSGRSEPAASTPPPATGQAQPDTNGEAAAKGSDTNVPPQAPALPTRPAPLPGPGTPWVRLGVGSASQGADAGYGIRMPVVTPTMRRYTLIRRVIYFVGTIYYLLLLWIVLRFRLSSRLRSIVENTTQRMRSPGIVSFLDRFPRLKAPASFVSVFVCVLIYYVLLSAVIALANAPLDVYSGYVIEHRYGLSDQSLGGWLSDTVKGFAVGVFTTAPLLALVYWLIRRSPKRWPLILWAVAIPLIAAGIFAQPLIIDPIFNKFTPLAGGPLRDHIHALAVQAGIPKAPILVADVSKQTNTTNAYVNGIGSSARIVLWDTLLKGKNAMPDRQILTIVGHEMGHYVLKHIYWGFLEAVGGLFFVLPFLAACYTALVKRYGSRWGVGSAGDLAAIPALLLTFSVISFFANPVVNALSRRVEHQADAYGLKVTHDPIGMAEAFVSLSEQNLSDPDPPRFLSFWFGSHPTLKERIEFALSKCPEYGCSPVNGHKGSDWGRK